MRDEILDCSSFEEALRLLREHGVKFDRAYTTIFNGRFEVLEGIHVYFNNGEKANVAYYTPSLRCLNIFADWRRDDTPPEQRRAKDIKGV